MNNDLQQRIASIVRQVLAVAVTLYTVIATNQGSLHLPTAVTAALTAFGPVILAIEHYTADPSTGTTPPPAPPTPTEVVKAQEVLQRSSAMPPKAS